MIALLDGRTVRVRRNGACFVTLNDVHDQLTLDHAHALKLADAFEQGRRLKVVAVVEGRTWLYNGGVHLGQVNVKQSHGPWSLDESQRKQLAEEIRAAVNG
jgi:hypothetical protein